jgi:hypothetical protein
MRAHTQRTRTRGQRARTHIRMKTNKILVFDNLFPTKFLIFHFLTAMTAESLILVLIRCILKLNVGQSSSDSIFRIKT